MAETLHTDQPTFSNATFLSTNVDLNYSAPTGFYSKEGRVRQWVNTGRGDGILFHYNYYRLRRKTYSGNVRKWRNQRRIPKF